MSKHRPQNQNFEYINNPYGTTPEPQKKSSKKKWVIGGAVVLGLAVIGMSVPADEDKGTDTAPSTTAKTTTQAVEADPAPQDEPQEAPEPEKKDGHTIRFEAETSDGSTGSVTYVGKGMDIVQHQDVPMPWSTDITGIRSKWDSIGANISVQQNGSGEVTCRVIWDGETVSENTSTGPFSIAMCSLPTDL